MPITYVAERGTFANTGSSGTIVIPVTGTVVVGNHLIAIFGHDAAALTIDSITDTQGNVWQLDREHTRGSSFTRYICSAKITTQLTTADSVTLDMSASRLNRLGMLQEFSGLAETSWLDQVASADGLSGTLASGATSTTSQPAELLIGGMGAGTTDMTFTPGTGYLQFTTPELYAGQNLYAEYRIVAATGTYQADGSQTSSQAWLAMIATYKAADHLGYQRLYGPAQLTTTAADLYTVPTERRTTVKKIYAANPSGSPVDFTLSIGTDAASTRLYDSYNIPAGAELDWVNRHAMVAGEKIQAYAGSSSTVVLVIDGIVRSA